ncbi:endonuclease/exonuclease/phosphatase family protein [Candidatus Kaiserbacteria bacterium]|nr:endonuclease/exonuclease/phosphatase family protein [Candidatus Kaiserbacteria bacterium]
MMTLSLLNWNIMHGRNKRSAVWPPRVSREEVQDNVRNIADCIRRYNPDVVTLQEVDEHSILSGSFNQFEFLNVELRYPYTYFAPSCFARLFEKDIFVSGNAILSRFPLEHCELHRFDFSFPTERQGFVIADALLPDGKRIAVASVHLVWLDWLRRDSRVRQVRQLGDVLAQRRGALVVAGDFNSCCTSPDQSLSTLLSKADLVVYEREHKDLNTHPSWDPRQRIDWVLISKDMHFVSHATIPDRLSDHLAIFASLARYQ